MKESIIIDLLVLLIGYIGAVFRVLVTYGTKGFNKEKLIGTYNDNSTSCLLIGILFWFVIFSIIYTVKDMTSG